MQPSARQGMDSNLTVDDAVPPPARRDPARHAATAAPERVGPVAPHPVKSRRAQQRRHRGARVEPGLPRSRVNPDPSRGSPRIVPQHDPPRVGEEGTSGGFSLSSSETTTPATAPVAGSRAGVWCSLVTRDAPAIVAGSAVDPPSGTGAHQPDQGHARRAAKARLRALTRYFAVFGFMKRMRLERETLSVTTLGSIRDQYFFENTDSLQESAWARGYPLRSITARPPGRPMCDHVATGLTGSRPAR